MALWRSQNKDITASLDFTTQSGGLELIKPIQSAIGQFLSGRMTTKEEPWQQEIRFYDLTGTAILGHSLDVYGFVASNARPVFVDPISGVEIENIVLQSKLNEPIWHYDQDFKEISNKAIRALAQVGEIDFVYYDDKYDFMHSSQRIEDIKDKKTGAEFIKYKLRENPKSGTIIIPKSNVKRLFVPQPGTSTEAYAPARRVLPVVRLYYQIMRQFQRIAFSNSLMVKIVHLGEDDETWKQDQTYISQFMNPNMAVPPAVNDFAILSDDIEKGRTSAPWYPTMGPTAPQAIDLTTSFDEQARAMLADCNREIAIGLNMPAKMLLGNADNHFAEAIQDEKFREFNVGPLNDVLYKFLDTNLFSKYPREMGISAKLSYSYDHVASNSLGPAQLIELFKIGAIGSKGIQKFLKISPQDAQLSAQDIKNRRELLTGDSGLQQAQLAQRDSYKQKQEIGIQAQAVPDTQVNPQGRTRISSTKVNNQDNGTSN